MEKQLILVDEFDNEIGTEEKIKAHKEGLLHRAFSIFVVNENNELLIQQRAPSKYHSPSLWSNTCCSHPEPGETLEASIHKRLLEEMGFDCVLKKIFHFNYNINLGNGLIENEFDHVYLGFFNSDPLPNPSEVINWKWQNIEFLKENIIEEPYKYTYWFKYIYEKFYEEVQLFQQTK